MPIIFSVKKVIGFPVPSQDEFQAGDGKLLTFLQCGPKKVVAVYLKFRIRRAFFWDRIILVTSLVKRQMQTFNYTCKQFNTGFWFNTHRPTAKAYSIAHKMLTQIIKSLKFLCLKPHCLCQYRPYPYSTNAYFQAELFPFIHSGLDHFSSA